jgi:hypothetical protein
MANPYQYNYISAISLLVDDEINPSAFDIYNFEGFTDIMGIMGRYKESKQPICHNYVNSDLAIQGDTTGATPTGSGTPTVTTVFTAPTSGYTRKNDLIIFPNGKVGHVQDVTGTTQDTVVIKSVDGTNLTHTAGQKLDIFSNAQGEASVNRKNLKFNLTKYVQNIQIFGEYNEETDLGKVSLIRVDFEGKPYFYAKNLNEKFLMHRASVNAACIGGKISTTLHSDAVPSLTDADTNAGGSVQTCRGLDQYATTYGVTDSVATPGTWLLADHSDVIDQLRAKRANIGDYMIVMPNKVKGKMDDTLLNLGSNGITSMRLNREAGGKGSLSFEVQKFSYKGMNAKLVVLPILDMNKTFSQTDIVKSAYYMPMDSVKTVDNGYQKRVQMRYQSHGLGPVNKGDKIWGEFHSGPISPVTPKESSTDGKKIWGTTWTTHQAPEILGAEHFAKSTVLV